MTVVNAPSAAETVGESMKLEVWELAGGFRGSPTFLGAARGALTVAELQRYLTGLHYLVSHTIPHLRLARARARECGFDALARYFEHKIEEEEGHVDWAESDLRGLQVLEGSRPLVDVPEAARRWVAAIERAIVSDPRDYLAHIFLTEYGTVIAGPDFCDALERKCGIGRELVSIIRNHVELDIEHAQELLTEFDRLVPLEKKAGLLDALRRFGSLWYDLSVEVIHESATSDRTTFS